MSIHDFSMGICTRMTLELITNLKKKILWIYLHLLCGSRKSNLFFPLFLFLLFIFRELNFLITCLPLVELLLERPLEHVSVLLEDDRVNSSLSKQGGVSSSISYQTFGLLFIYIISLSSIVCNSYPANEALK